MDLITLALARKYTDTKGEETANSTIKIGDNGNWYIKGIDTGLAADPTKNLVDVDGILKADTQKRNLVVVKDGNETIVGEYTTGIQLSNIMELFEEE